MTQKSVVDFYRRIFAELALLEKGRITLQGCHHRIGLIAEEAKKIGLNIQVPTVDDLRRDHAAQADKKVEQVLDKLDRVEEEVPQEDWCQPSYEEDEIENSYE